MRMSQIENADRKQDGRQQRIREHELQKSGKRTVGFCHTDINSEGSRWESSCFAEVGGNSLQANNGRQEFLPDASGNCPSTAKGGTERGQERNVVRDQHTAKSINRPGRCQEG